MADPVTPKAPVVAAVDPAKAKALLDKLAADAQKLAGHPNFNPYLWIRDVLGPLQQAVKAGDPSVMAKIEALKLPEIKK